MTRATEAGADDGAPGPAAPPGTDPASDRSGLRRATAATALVAVAVLATALAGPFRADFRPVPPRDVPEPTGPPLPEVPAPDDVNPFLEELGRDAGAPLDLTWVGLVLGTLAVLGVLLLVARQLRRLAWLRRGDAGPDDAGTGSAGAVAGPGALPDVAALREAAEDAVDHLAAPRAPADAVIAAWVALEGAAARSGVRREPAQTPTEFTLVVLDRTPADRDATRVLLALYLRARFGEDPLTRRDVDDAAAAATALARSLEEEP